MRPKSFAVSLFPLLLLVPLTAQRTWIVDENGGAGHDFKDLPPALTAANDGDTIVVRKGYNYTAGSTSKALRILGEGGPSIYFSNLIVIGLAAGKSFVVHGIDFSYANLHVQSCQGAVHAEKLTGSGVRFTVGDSKHVTFNGCTLQGGGGPALTVSASSRVAISGGQITGMPAMNGKYFSTPSQPALSTSNSSIAISGGSIVGGNAYSFLPASPGMFAIATQLVVTGTTATRFAAGNGTPGVHAVVTTGGSIVRDPRVQFGTIGGDAAVTTRAITALTASGAAPGGSVVATQSGRPGDAIALLAAAAMDPIPTPYGDLWLNLTTLLTLDTVVLDASGQRQLLLPVPQVSALRGLPIALQSVGGTFNPEYLTLSPPAIIVLN